MGSVPEETQSKTQLHDHADIPVRYASLERVYSVSSSSSSLCCVSTAGSHNVVSKTVNAQDLPSTDAFQGHAFPDDLDSRPHRRPEIVRVYSRRRRRRRGEEEEEKKKKKKRRSELTKLGVDSTTLSISTSPLLRGCRTSAVCSGNNQNGSSKKKGKPLQASATAKKWVRLSYDGVDPKTFIGLQCKVFWPLDADWYPGSIIGYNVDNKHHIIKYGDGDVEELALHREMIKYFISRQEMELLNLKFGTNDVAIGGQDYDEMVVLAASFEGSQDFEPRDIIWAKLTGLILYTKNDVFFLVHVFALLFVEKI